MVSVIIPNYNHEKYLQHRIDSVLNQTYQDFELIILDDKSKDSSIEIIEKYRNHPKVSHVVYNEVNSGTTFKQWKKGIELAQGEYIWIAESDDYADVTFLEKIISLIEKNNSVLCFSQSYVIDEYDTIKRKRDEVLKTDFCNLDYFLSNNLLYGNVIYNASMVVFRKDAIEESIWEELTKLTYCGDWLFWAKLAMNTRGTVSEVKEYLNYFRNHSSNVSNRSEVNGLTFLEGFPISKMIAKRQGIKSDKQFREKWFAEWQHYRLYYLLSKKTNLKILLLFLRQQPIIAFYEFKRLFLRLFK
ncbi:glycosyltransferase involved in cell wall biosynthesis [Dysgonomonas alginatilytica]|uniref:Glycosyltransferase involved in cell wall biosynthesis n=1 Tax=Dysgonomonas alginatilytica TaxID=1605892 RepID=A0A2V3PR76_9BACT|nr:glycosyltransferase family 2 protein [Dysgonomonas alginatilytica]PXV64126.1 glycosyltransferase involved in cell wall biosynthesis [Dysgonomonas alginatilytica]